MRPNHKTSTPEVLINVKGKKTWVQTHMENIDEGDIFRIRKPDGTLHVDMKTMEIMWKCTQITNIECRRLYKEEISYVYADES